MSSTETMLTELSDAELDTVAAGTFGFTNIKQVSILNAAAASNVGVNASLFSVAVAQGNFQSASANAGNNIA